MEIEKSILLRYYEQATIEQLASEYKQKGYEVFNNYQSKQYHFDLVAQKDDDLIVFEIKAGLWEKDRRKEVQQLRNFAIHELGAKFKLVLVSLPEEPEIQIEELEAKFSDLLADQFIDELSKMATHFWVDAVSDIKFDELSIRKSELEIKGIGTISVEFQYGSDSDYEEDNGMRWTDSFEFDFHLLLDRDLEIKEVYELKINKLEESE